VWTVGNFGAIYRWNGVAWTQVTTGLPFMGNQFGVWGSNPNDVWIAGGFGTILHWNGLSWSSPPTRTLADPMRSLLGALPNVIWAVGASGALLRWNGSAWSGGSGSATTGALTSVWGNGPNDVWAVGCQTAGCADADTNGVILHWDGSQMTRVTCQSLG